MCADKRGEKKKNNVKGRCHGRVAKSDGKLHERKRVEEKFNE